MLSCCRALCRRSLRLTWLTWLHPLVRAVPFSAHHSFTNIPMWKKEFVHYADIRDDKFPFVLLGNKVCGKCVLLLFAVYGQNVWRWPYSVLFARRCLGAVAKVSCYSGVSKHVHGTRHTAHTHRGALLNTLSLSTALRAQCRWMLRRGRCRRHRHRIGAKRTATWHILKQVLR